MSGKVWDEHWDLLREAGHLVGLDMDEEGGGARGGILDFAPVHMNDPEYDDAVARAKLAAAAPEMARLLLEVEWAGLDVEVNGGGDDPIGRADFPVCYFCRQEAARGEHASDCRWLAWARRIGARE